MEGRKISEEETGGGAHLSNGSRSKEGKLFQFCSDSIGLEQFGPGSGWNWFNEVHIWKK